MKNRLLGIFAIVFLLAMPVLAYPTSTGEVSTTPQAGVFKTLLSSNDVKGAICQIGGNTFQYVDNAAPVPCFQGEAAFWSIGLSSQEAYSVTTYESTSNYDTFAGVWYCDKYGSTVISSDEAGWIQTKGVGNAYVSGEGTAIVVGDILAGTTTPSAALTDTKARTWLVRDHAIRTSSTGTSSYEVNVLRFPKAMEARAAGAASLLMRIFLGY